MRPGQPEPHYGPDPPDQSAQLDARTVRQVLAGDRRAFEELVRRHERRALTVAYRLLNQAEDAQEVVQDALLRAYQALDSLVRPELFGPWLLRIVSNLALNYRRSRARRSAASLDDSPDRRGEGDPGDALSQVLVSAEQQPDQELMTAELRGRIRQALDKLPDRQRTALVLFSIEQLPQRDVAEILGCSVEAVKWHVFAARQKLKEMLADLLG